MLEAIQQRLRDPASGLKLVEGAAAFQAAADTNPKATPAAYVLLLGEKRSEDLADVIGLVEQRVVTRIGIVLVARNVADPRGDSASGDMQTLRQAVRTLLFGWQPTANHDALVGSDSALLAFRDQHQWWQDIYLTSSYERSN